MSSNAIHRSEEMCLAQLFLQNEAAYACVAELGELGLVQFRDLNPDVSAFQRHYVKEVRRCDEMERKLRYLEREIKKDSIPMLDTHENPEAPQPREMYDLEATFEKLEKELREVNHNEEMLKKNYAELTELKHVLRKTQQFFDENEGERQALDSLAQDDEARLIQERSDPQHGKTHLKFVAGVIQRERLPAFERLLWRACRGNVFLRQSEITESLNDPTTGIAVNKSVFIVFFQGDQLKSRVKKICEGFRAAIYPCPDTPQERREMSIGVMTRIEDLKIVLGQTQDHRHRVLVAAAKNVRLWMTKVHKIKAIYHTLNLFNLDVTQKCLIAECWCPVAEFDRIQWALKRGSEESGSTVPSIMQKMETHEAPPTFNRTNKFTKGFQNIVDAYGIASYREINPAPYTMITFPFLFALMFGDLGHGMIMFLAATYFIWKEKQLEAARISDEIFQTFFGGRYVIFLMGAFSLYTGLIYNDAFSKSFNLFGTSWKNTYKEDFLTEAVRLEPEKPLFLTPEASFTGEPYPVGVDPAWNLAETNKLNFLNSMKMKASVLIGISQMTFGVALSYHNHKYFNSALDIRFTFIPQVLFLSCIFIYLCLEIIAKWLYFSATPGYVLGFYYPGSNCAPSLLIGLINMFMMKSRSKGFVDGNTAEGKPLPLCHLNYWYPGQGFIETVLLLIAIVSVPVMLIAKPYLLWKEDKQRKMAGHTSVRADVGEDGAEVIHHENNTHASGAHGGHGNEPFDLGNIMVYQAIHTIEFVLGCVSHTASYLRLWALSLAHGQLSDVLWTMVFRISLSYDGYVGAVATYVIFFVFASLTVSILVLMEGLSAFLHALRLHWVEFQSKFYSGSGYAFLPFSFEKILEEARAAEEQLTQ
ncbi:v-type proton ATPase subunit a isoform 1-like isoform 2 [Aphelenchoides avenae]|nr:v-type proton ATPase subunit a isoform 1-like isoform 2 [Aphelenchus avenae]